MKKYNSFLFVPANEKMLAKIEKVKADAVIIDLEDAVLPEDKDKALWLVDSFLQTYSYHIDIFIRINPLRMKRELEVLNKYKIKGYMLPKTETKDDVENLKRLSQDKQIIALIESPKGIINISEIVGYSGVDMAAFGAEDYTTQCGIKNTDEFLVYPKSKMVAYAKAYNKPVIDTISLNITSEEDFMKSAQNSKDFGFDGKLAIHPMQVDIINQVFADDIKYFKYVVNEYEKQGKGVLNLDGKVFEKPHIDAMRRIIEEKK